MASSAETFRERTNANQFQQRQRLPPNFSIALKEYTREVLRVQPEDIFAWSANYFKQLALSTYDEPLQVRQPPPDHYRAEVENPEREVVAMKINKAFASMDQQRKGRLFVDLVKRILVESVQLSSDQALYVLTSDYVAIGEDATVDYTLLSRDCVSAVLFFAQNSEFEFPEESLRNNDDEAVVHGRTRVDVEDTLREAAASADVDGRGRISYANYIDVLENAPIDLTRRDIKMLCVEAALTRDGTVDIRVEVSAAFDRLLIAARLTAFDEQHAQ